MTQVARYTVLGALFLIPLLPLYVSSSLFFPFITGKGFAFRIFVEVALVAYVLLAIFDAKYRPRFSWTLLLFGAFVAWMAIADAFGVNPLKAFWSNFERMDGWVTLVHLFAFFVVSGAVLTVDNLWRKWWLTFLSVAALVCTYGIFQLLGVFEINQGGVRVDATFGNAAYLASYLLFVTAVAVWQALISKGSLRYWLFALAVLAGLIVFFTATRGAILGLVGGVGLASLLWLIDSRKEWKTGLSKGAKIAAGVLVAGVLVVGGFLLIKDSAFVQGDPTLARISSISFADLAVRFTVWNMAFEGFKERPLTGWGQEGFNQVFNKHYQPSMYAQEAWFDRAHNAFLDWLLAGGLPALLLFLALVGSALVVFYRSEAVSRPERVFLIAALGAYGIQGLVVFDHLFTYVPLAAILALAHGAASRPIRSLEEAPTPTSETASAIALPVAGAVAIALVFFVNVPNIQAANKLVYAISPNPAGADKNLEFFKEALETGTFATQEIREQLVLKAVEVSRASAAPNDLKRDFSQLAVEEIGKEVERSPNDARLRLQYSNALDAAGDHERAMEEIEAAIALSPNKQMLFLSKAVQQQAVGDMEGARDTFRYAYELDPSFDELAVYAAAGEIMAGNVPAGKAILEDAFGTTTVDSDPLFFAYYQTRQHNDLILVAQARVTATNGDPEARLRLAQAYAVAGRIDAARSEIAATIAAHPEIKPKGDALLSELSRLQR